MGKGTPFREGSTNMKGYKSNVIELIVPHIGKAQISEIFILEKGIRHP